MNETHFEKAAYVLKSIAHPARLNILSLLGENDRLSVNDICELIQCEQSLTSHHLHNLKDKGVIGSRREGKKVFYFLKEKGVLGILECMEKCACFTDKS